MKTLLIKIIAALSVLTPQFSFAAEEFDQFFGKYQNQSINRDCSVSYQGDMFYLTSNRPGRMLVSHKINELVKLSPGLFKLKYSNYDGEAEVYFIKKEESKSLKVIFTWHDNDNGYDSASFCEVPKK